MNLYIVILRSSLTNSFEQDLLRSWIKIMLLQINSSYFELYLLGFSISWHLLKKKTLRNNKSSFTTKEVRKAIMTRSRLRNKFLKIKSQECKQAYNKQRNLCVTMVRKAKKNYFNCLNVRNIKDNRQFWKTVKPFFSSKIGGNEWE